MSNDLIIKDLYARIGDKEILRGVNLTVRQGTIHAIMGPNGSGKSTLSYIIAGHPSYEVTGGEIWYKGHNLLELEPDERSRLGVFLAFQYPVAVPGVTVANFLRSAINAHRAEEGKDPKETAIPAAEFRKLLREGLNLLDMDESFARRYLNDGFSGGEKKRLEILQMMLLKPSMAVLDETDSGLDIDALRIVANGVNRMAGPHMGVLVITHYQRLLNYIKPDVVSVMMDGRIVREGGPELALELEEKGYDWLREELTGAA
ncbi:Fe-S cluster assembly ATPase SufC [Chloroflexus sp.]|uniref:Fe-S cluster assembly ATPase SufC n=1 Tax=Chloroflexus sp. TaxID=1904827 RepID=UPI00298EDE2F|nr:Fe-S cluster assembly ATPase SufC [Chloroflexus sp.]MCS6888055.1 Fe-S cluster assembly ATPase SufC [Chloroflexus sp.]MCX7859300.1 Fe-S cluster assembly ATPase SufC [Chloroflexus sp.]MDW8402750.1 Fe-S cluster assembly ATPase SufC [Chloroflexus sp.]